MMDHERGAALLGDLQRAPEAFALVLAAVGGGPRQPDLHADAERVGRGELQ